jgi:hypothetical protein
MSRLNLRAIYLSKMICPKCSENRTQRDFVGGDKVCIPCNTGELSKYDMSSEARRVLNSVTRVNDTENISTDKAFFKFGGEMLLVLKIVSGAIDTLLEKPKNDIEEIYEWLNDWDWVAESDPGRDWSFDWCVGMLALTRARYDAGKLRERVQANAYDYNKVCEMKERAIRGLASQKGAVLWNDGKLEGREA